MLRAVGMGDEDWDKPQIGIASSWNEITPCNLSLGATRPGGQGGRARRRRLPAAVRHRLGVRRHRHGARGHALLAGQPRGHRRLCRDGHAGGRLDGSGAAGRCAKSPPGMLMAAARLELRPSSSTPARSPGRGQAQRRHREKRRRSSTLYEAVGRVQGRDDDPGRPGTASNARSPPARAPAAACTPPTPWPAPSRPSA